MFEGFDGRGDYTLEENAMLAQVPERFRYYSRYGFGESISNTRGRICQSLKFDALVQQVEYEAKNQSLNEISHRLEVYREQAEITQRRLDAYIQSTYGIDHFSAQVDQWMPADNEPIIAMGRQIPTFSIEALSFILLRDWMERQGLRTKAGTISFERDSFGSHDYKSSLVRVNAIDWQGNTLHIDRKKILSEADDHRLDSRPILKSMNVTGGSYWNVDIENGTGLIDFHQRMRNAALHGKAGDQRFDISDKFENWIRACMQKNAPRKPDHLYIDKGGFEQRINHPSTSHINGESVRPPAMWYYFLYLSLFTMGNRILVASLDDDESVHEMFATMNQVREACGMSPNILWIPYKSENIYHFTSGEKRRILHNEVNPYVFQDPQWFHKIKDPVTANPFIAMQHFESELLRLGQS